MSIRPALLGAAAGTILATVAYVSLADAALNRPAPAAAGQRPVTVAPTTAEPMTASAAGSPAPCEPPSVLTGDECVVTIVGDDDHGDDDHGDDHENDHGDDHGDGLDD